MEMDKEPVLNADGQSIPMMWRLIKMVDAYTKKWVKLINVAPTDKELHSIVSKIWEEGFEDGINEYGIK